jgi:glutamyl endopeptidase
MICVILSIFFVGALTVSSNLTSALIIVDEDSITVEYNIETQVEFIGERTIPYYASSQGNIVQPFYGDYISHGLHLSYPFPPDDRIKIEDTTTYPWSTICKLYITTKDNVVFIGSGAMIDEFHILTAGHCVYAHDHGGWVKNILIIPGMDGSYEPFGRTHAAHLRTFTGWIEDEMVEHDLALVTLENHLGVQTGWMGRKTSQANDPIYTGVLNLAGYPGDLDNGEFMYYDSDMGEDATEYNHWFWMDAAGGQSGSPVWQEDGGEYYILSVFAYEYLGGTYANFGTRLNQDKFDSINSWLMEDSNTQSPSSPYNNNLIILISIVSTIGVIIIISGVTLFFVIRKKAKRKITNIEALDQYSTYPTFTQELIYQYTSTQGTYSYCPMCGSKLVNPSSKFCVICGYKFQRLPA